jgi:glycogen debranching enzyme
MDNHTMPQADQPTAPESWEPALQPFLHDRCIDVRAPSFVIAGPDGQIAGSADGFFHQDRRALSRLVVKACGVPLVPIHAQRDSGSSSRFRAVLRGLGEHSADPAVTLERHRNVEASRFTERLIVTNRGRRTVSVSLEIEAAADLASMNDVKTGRSAVPVPSVAVPGGLDWKVDKQAEISALSVRMKPEPDRIDGPGGLLSSDIVLEPGDHWEGTLTVTIAWARPAPFAPYAGPPLWRTPHVGGADPRLTALVNVSVADLDCLLLADTESAPGTNDTFLTAGAPWFLTLFGRDSLWAAHMLLPLSTELAAGTLRTLARRQGTRVDRDTGEEPGKILHEIRIPRAADAAHSLPPRYYGTIDATPLWLVLLRDAWRWGLPDDEVEPLLDAAYAALCWMRDYGDGDGDGLLEYLDLSGRGLANQGWRDSADSIRWHDGRLAEGPIALAEVQAYAYQAAWAGAELLDSFGRAGADEWRQWAEALKARFNAAFWIDRQLGPVPAVALDRHKRPVDSVTSGLGHLLATGLLDRGQQDAVAAYLASPQLDSRFGLRTLSADAVGFNPIGYHTGSVWPHDTAIAARGLARAGHPAAAWSLIDGVLEAADSFDYRLPELFGGYGRAAHGIYPGEGTAGEQALWARPAPYPAACRPQAWAAAASVSFLQTLLGLEANAPARCLTVAPVPAALPLKVSGLRLAGSPFSVEVTADGRVQASTPADMTVKVAAGGRDRTRDSVSSGGSMMPVASGS